MPSLIDKIVRELCLVGCRWIGVGGAGYGDLAKCLWSGGEVDVGSGRFLNNFGGFFWTELITLPNLLPFSVVEVIFNLRSLTNQTPSMD